MMSHLGRERSDMNLNLTPNILAEEGLEPTEGGHFRVDLDFYKLQAVSNHH